LISPSYHLPRGWEWTKLSEIVKELESGGRPKGGVRGITSGVPSIGGEHLHIDGGFNFQSIRFVPKSYAVSMRHGHIASHDVLVVKDGATTGKTSFVADDFPYKEAILNEHVFRLQVFPEVATQRYLFYFLRGPLGQKMIRDSFRGSAQGGINQSFVDFVHIPLAPLREQERIVLKLERLLNHAFSARNALQVFQTVVMSFRRSVLAKAFKGDLTVRQHGAESAEKLLQKFAEERNVKLKQNVHAIQETRKKYEYLVKGRAEKRLPEGWAWTSIADLTESWQYGPRFAKGEYVKEGVMTIRTTDMDYLGRIVLSSPPRLHLNQQQIEHFGLRSGDLLIARSGNSIGKCTVYEASDEPAIAGAYLIRFRLFMKLLLPRYILYYLLSPQGQSLLREGTVSVAQPNINARKIERFPVPLAPETEMKQVLSKVETLFAQAQAVETQIKSASHSIEKAARAVMNAAFRGELVPQDPNDEPASALLETIRAQRATVTKRGRHRLEEFASPATISPKA